MENGTSKEQIKLKNEFQIELQIKEFLDGNWEKRTVSLVQSVAFSADGKLSVKCSSIRLLMIN